jgi:hypothetical protein
VPYPEDPARIEQALKEVQKELSYPLVTTARSDPPPD